MAEPHQELVTAPLPVLELRRVRAAYGQIEVLHGIDIAVQAGSVLALLGPNGAGKSTALKVASGQMVPTAGCFHVMGRHANGMKADALSRAGLCTLPDGRGIFPNLTVTENLRLMTFGGASRSTVEERAFARFPRLSERRGQIAGTLSGGEQQMLAMARTLSVEPAVLLLDEISMGLAPMIVSELYELVAQIAAEGVSVILAEQFAATALGVATHVAVVVQGRIVAAGTPDELPSDLADAYLGRGGRMKRVPALALATFLLLGGGTGVLVASLSNGSAGADTTLGGFTVSALAEASTAQYEQPNLPIPATPSLEFDEGYAATSDNFGPSGSATASTLYPGQVVANIGPQLALILPGVPLPPVPAWPVQALSTFPEKPNAASSDEPGLNMDAISSTDGSEATATIGTNAPAAGATGTTLAPGLPSLSGLTGLLGSLSGVSTTTGSGNPLGSVSSVIGIGFSSGTSSSGASGALATATGVATDTGISILAGLINIGGVTTTATATSDGTTGKVTGSTVLTNVNIAGTAVTIDGSGLHAVGENAGSATVVNSLNTILKELGITLTLTTATDAVTGPSASRTLDGLKLTINLNTLDTAANKFASLLPASLIAKLPIALPNMQLLTLDLGTVSVSSTASPPFTATGDSGTGGTGNTGSGLSAQSLGSTLGNSGSGGTFGGGTFGNSGAGGSATPTSTAGGTGGGTSTTGTPASAVTPAFSGIGWLLILLGLVASGALAYAYKRVDDASEMVGAACTDGDPLADRFADDDTAGGLV